MIKMLKLPLHMASSICIETHEIDIPEYKGVP